MIKNGLCTPLHCLKINKKILSRLNEKQITTIKELLDVYGEDFDQIPYIGKKSYQEIYAAIENAGVAIYEYVQGTIHSLRIDWLSRSFLVGQGVTQLSQLEEISRETYLAYFSTRGLQKLVDCLNERQLTLYDFNAYFPEYQGVLNTKTCDLGLNQRELNILQQNGIFKIGQLLDYYGKDFQNFRGLGPKGYEQIYTAIENIGISFDDSIHHTIHSLNLSSDEKAFFINHGVIHFKDMKQIKESEYAKIFSVDRMTDFENMLKHQGFPFYPIEDSEYIETSSLPARIKTALVRHGFTKKSDLTNLSIDELKGIRNLGESSLKHIIKWITPD